jgi:hypothetical protein
MGRLVAVSLVAFSVGPGAVAARAAELPLGPRSLEERRTTVEVAPGVSWTRIVRTGGPWRVNLLTVARGARVLAVPAGAAVGERARPSTLARRTGAVAAVNGGYFASDGNPVGVLAAGGRLLSEPVAGRAALLLAADPARRARVAGLRFAGSVHVGGAGRLLDGVNRAPGRVPACGGRGGDRPTERPDAVTTCTDPSELVLFTPEWGPRTPRGAGRVDAEVRGGVVGPVRRGGGVRIPGDGAVLSGTGDAARLLRRSDARPAVTIDLGLRSGRTTLAAAATAAVVGGGPRLLLHGRVRVRSWAEGFAPAPWFFGSFVATRQPRTLAGVRRDGSLLLVTVDGRATGWSAGVTLFEAARVMRALGAREALNLDGGGSSAMAVRGQTVSRPSDPSGERRVSDALVVLP